MKAPLTELEASSFILEAAADGIRLAIRGGQTRTGLHGNSFDAQPLATTGLTGITLYEPSEMVIAARAGTPLAEVEAVLAEKGQRLTFEPMDHRKLYGTVGNPTIGAVAACNISGPRRIQAGAARDSLIGLRFINGKGEILRAGGRVMKNVTGLDLVKLQAGARGQLGLLSEVTFKVLPKPETAATLLLRGLSDEAAVAAMAAALGSPFEVNGAAHLPGAVLSDNRTCLRIENVAAAVAYRFEQLAALLKPHGLVERLDGVAQDALWRGIRDVEGLAAATAVAIWRISVKPSDGPKFVAAIQSSQEAHAMYDLAGGLVWLGIPASGDAGSEAIRSALARFGGHARLENAPDGYGNRNRNLPAMDPAVQRLEEGIRLAMDPNGVFSAVSDERVNA